MNLHRGMRVGVAAVAFVALALVAAAPASAAPPIRTQTPVITAKPTSPTGATTASFSFASSTANAAYTCSIDGRASSCTSPVTYSGLTNGSHSFAVKAQAPGAKSSGAATASWTVDTVAPSAPSVTGPATVTNVTAPSPSFSNTSLEAVTFLCSLDGSAAAPCTSGSAVSAPTEGAHTFSVFAQDIVGNLSTPATVGWTLDISVAKPFVLSGPVSLTSATSATFAFGSTEDGVTFECRLDTEPWVSACTSPVTFTGLVPSAHTFLLRATDPVGNAATSDSFGWTVGTTPLTFSWTDPTSLPSGVTSSTTADFNFLVTGITTLSCTVVDSLGATVFSLDGSAAAPCSSSVSVSGLVDGLYTFTLLADATLPTQSTMSFTWAVDTMAPNAPTISAPTGWVATAAASVVVTAAGASDKLSCTVDGVSTPCATSVPLSLTGLAEGLHLVVATASDKAGNLAQSQATWNVDTLAPVPTVTSPTTLTGTVSVTFDDQVTGGGTNPVLELVDGTAVATSRKCLDAVGVSVSCALQARRVVLTPVSPLVAGQTYVVSINRAATAPVVDLAGNPAVTAAPTFRAALVVQENGPTVVQSWRTVSASAAKGRSYVKEVRLGARATWKFTGRAFTTYLVSGPSFGYVTVFVDGVKRAAWNQYATSTRYTSARTISGLSNAAHTVSYVVTGKRGSTKATGYAVGIDAVKVGAAATVSPRLTLAWSRVKSASASGLYRSVASQSGQSTSLSFVGTGITWAHSVGRNHGKAHVYVDGVKRGTIDLYATTAKNGVTWTMTGLAPGKHSIRIVATGTKRSTSTGTLVTMDRFTVK